MHEQMFWWHFDLVLFPGLLVSLQAIPVWVSLGIWWSSGIVWLNYDPCILNCFVGPPVLDRDLIPKTLWMNPPGYFSLPSLLASSLSRLMLTLTIQPLIEAKGCYLNCWIYYRKSYELIHWPKEAIYLLMFLLVRWLECGSNRESTWT